MKPFLTRSESQRKQEALKRSCNPAPGRKPKHHNRISRAVRQIATRTHSFLEATNYEPKPWLPHDAVITVQDEDFQYDLHAQLHDCQVEDDGYMVDWADPSIKATNRVIATSWYDSELGDSFILRKPVLSPLPCDEWGRIPLTLKQWQDIALDLTKAECLWRWVHAVRVYTSDDTYQLGGIVGWFLEPAQKVVSYQELADHGKGYMIDNRSEELQQQDARGWIGRNFYLDIIAGFSLDD